MSLSTHTCSRFFAAVELPKEINPPLVAEMVIGNQEKVDAFALYRNQLLRRLQARTNSAIKKTAYSVLAKALSLYCLVAEVQSTVL